MGKLATPLLHYPYASVEEWVAAINRHTTLGARSLVAARTRPSLRRTLTTPALHFTRRLVGQAAWRDGTAGVIAAALAATGGFLVHAKHWSLSSTGASDPAVADRAAPKAPADAR